MLFFGSVYGLEKVGGSTVWKPWVRGVLADYSFVFPTLFWVGFSHFPGRLGRTDQYRVPTVGAFQPTQDRNWVIEFWTLDVKWVFVALPFGFLMMLLFYYDHVSWSCPCNKTVLIRATECVISHRASPPIPSQETCRIPLGLLSAWLHLLCIWDHRVASA